MTELGRDIVFALKYGVIVPAVMLSFAANFYYAEQGTVPVFDGPAEELAEAKSAIPISLRDIAGDVQISDLETYLVGVVLAEMPAEFETEALKAQAVAARTFTCKAYINGGKHGDGSVCMDPGCCQAYCPPEEYLESGGNTASLEKVRMAVEDTWGQVLVYEGDLIEATYFACSGGQTEDAATVWGTDYPYLVSVESPGEDNAPYYRDTVCFTRKEFCNALGQNILENWAEWIGEISYTKGGGVEFLQIGEQNYSGTELRKLLGLRSTSFEIEVSEEGVTISTAGYGHRVGMSQYGADAMAVSGRNYREILVHYYPGTEIEDWKTFCEQL